MACLLIEKKKIMGKQPNVAASTVDSKESCENFWISGKTETNMLSLSFFFFGLCMCLKKVTYTSGVSLHKYLCELGTKMYKGIQ